MASLRLRLGLLAAAAVAAAFIYPAFVGGPDLDRTALALALAGPAAGTALAAATGRPPLVATALAGVGGYASGLIATHGIAVPLAIVLGALVGAAAGAVVGLLSARLDGAAFLIATLLLALALGAAVQALPQITGAQSGLGPLPGISVQLSQYDTAVLTPLGDFHVVLGVAVVTMGVAALLLRRGPGPAWRAVGSDRLRARSSLLRPLLAEVSVLAVAGLMAAFSGALAAHISRAATPASFAPDLAALPLLAALAAGRQPIGAGLVAVATGLVGEVILPALGWNGPPSAEALALGILAVAALFTLLPGGGGAPPGRDAAVDAETPWPLEALGLAGGSLRAEPLTVRASRGEVLVEAPALNAAPGTITAVVGPNGSGKTTLFRDLDRRAPRRRGVEVVRDGRPGRLVLLPQEGGGFASCTVRETLDLAARQGGRSREAARQLASEWVARLGLEGSSGVLCSELSAGQRRLVDLARVLLGAPDVLLCDEPLAGLDDNHRAAATACLRAAANAGATIVLSEHDREAVAALAGTVVELERRA